MAVDVAAVGVKAGKSESSEECQWTEGCAHGKD